MEATRFPLFVVSSDLETIHLISHSHFLTNVKVLHPFGISVFSVYSELFSMIIIKARSMALCSKLRNISPSENFSIGISPVMTILLINYTVQKEGTYIRKTYISSEINVMFCSFSYDFANMQTPVKSFINSLQPAPTLPILQVHLVTDFHRIFSLCT